MDDHVVFITVGFVAEGMHGMKDHAGSMKKIETDPHPYTMREALGFSLADQEPPL